MKQQRTIIGLLLVFAIFIGLGVGGWFLMKNRILNRSKYRLSADKISVTETPPWVSGDFVTDVLRSSGLDTESTLFDASLPQKLSQAFSAAPWVEEVQQVQLFYPSGAMVKLVYRSPVALVEMASQGLYPVDGNGILLPTDYFIHVAPEKLHEYPRISGIRSNPLGTAGSPWGDSLVDAAAQLAKNLEDVTTKLQLARIIPSSEQTPTGNRIVLRIQTESGMEIIWGDDSKSDSKKKQLLDIAERYHLLDNVPEKFRPIDLSKD